MACLTFSQLNISKAILKTKFRQSELPKAPGLLYMSTSSRRTRAKLPPLLSTKNISWETALPYSSAESGGSLINGNRAVEPIDSEETREIPMFHSEQDVVEVKSSSFLMQLPLKWSMWLLGPSILLATGIVPTLWLPLAPVFPGANIAGLLSVVGLDCIFNIGAMLFLLMADACGRPRESSTSSAVGSRIPLRYKLWNIGASALSFLVPLLLLLPSCKSTLRPQLPFNSLMVLLGPYLLLLSIQMLTEMLTWHWRSPVWLVAPIVYEGYRVLQLMRGISMAGEVRAPAWMVDCLCWLVMWWVLILGIQLMHVASFAGLQDRSES
ncbi:uncharacterized protein LOC109707819 [Ananas comosus]|uniref:Uncharacterized protein LOC109707819 n=1 Tax=Ananas comosus TaxID=4615 RepID=A0A6P5EMS9_ANACO|nr:uncharacterized protein LOC109707819 [Ananas comosus]